MEKETFVLVDNVPTKKAIDGSIIMESSNYFNLTEQEVCGGDKEISKNSQKKTYPTVRCTTDIFCWLKCVYESVRLKVKIENPEKATLPIMKQYLKFIRDDVPSCTRFPNRCYILSRNVTRTLLLFKGLNRNFTDTHEYLSQLSELLTIYTTLELIYSTKFEESKIAVANRISLNYDVHLKEFDQIYIIKILISIKNFYQQKEVMRKLFEKYLKRKCVCASQKELPDKIFVMYLIAYKYWISLEDDLDEKSKIEDIANAFMRPSTTLRRNYLYAPYIPAYKVTNQSATKCILSQSFNLLSLTKAVENDEQRTGRSPSRDIIDLSVCCDDNHLDLTQNESSEVVAFPKVKLERPEIIATVDLTTCKWDHDLNWLDTLIGKVRSLCSVSSCMNIVEIIDLDNDTTENIHDPEVSNTNDNCTETVSIEKSANNMSKLNNLSPNDLETGMDSPFGINKMNKDNESTEIVSFAAEVVNSTSFLRQNVNLSTKSTEHINESPLNADDNLRPEIDIRSHTEKIIWSQPVPKASKSDDIQDEANDQGADMSCRVNCGASDQLVSSVRIPANEVKEDETNQNVDPESSQLEIIKPCNRECNSEADSSDPSERRDVHNFALSDVGKDDLVKNVVEQQKMTKEFCADLILSNEKNRNMAANHKVTDTLGTNTMKDLKKNNSIVDGENKVLDNGKQNPISEGCNVLEDSVNSETKGEPSCEVYEESPNVLSFEPFNIDDRKISINSTGLNIKTYSNRHKKLPKNKLSTVDTTIGGAHSGEEKSSSNPCDISKSEYSNELLHFSNELNSNSVEYQKSGGGVETYESAESQKDLFTDIAAKKADIDVLQDSLTSLGNIDDCSLQNLLDDEDDNIIKDIAKKLTVNSKRGQVKKKKDEAHNMNKRKNLPHSENTLLDLPIFSSSSEENDDSGDSNILSILDDSDNTEEESVNIISSHENQDDTPVQKILPKMELSGTKGSQNGNIIFRVIPKPFDKKKNIDSTWLDPTLDFEENFVNTNQHEITSPPMEQFTKSDKTLFKTYLDKANDTLCGKLDEKNRNEPVPSSQEIVGSNIKQKADANVNVPLTFVNISETPSVPYNQRRKTVSFLGIQPEANQKEKHFFKTPGDLTQSTFQQSSLPGKECWTAAINTYRSNSQLNMKSTAPSSSKDNVTPINLNSKSSSSFATDPGMDKSKIIFNTEMEAQLPIASQSLNISKVSHTQSDTNRTINEKGKNIKSPLNVSNSRCHVRTDLMVPNILPQQTERFNFNSNSIHVENSSHIHDDLDKNLSPILPHDDLREVLSDDRFLLYYDEENVIGNQENGRNSSCESNIYKDVSGLTSSNYYPNDLGISVQQWLDENIDKRIEAQISLPLKKRRKLSQFSDNLSLKEEDLQYIDSFKIGVQDESKQLMSESVPNPMQCGSYPSTPMLSIANFENMICFTQPPRRQFKTPAQLKEITPVNLQTFNILPTQHTIVNSSSATNCNDVARTVQTFNILNPQQTLVSSNRANPTKVQTYSIIPTQGNVVPSNTRNLFNDAHICNVSSGVPTSADVNSLNVGFDLSSRGELPNVQTFNLSPNTIQYTHSFHPNQQYTYSIQSNQPQNNIGAINVPSFDIQNMINLSNYHMNSQHLSNFLHNSQINLQAKQAVLLNDVPCNLQINHNEPPQVRPTQNSECNRNMNSFCSQKCDGNLNCFKQNQTSCGSCRSLLTPLATNVTAPTNSSTRGKQKKSKSRTTDRITRSSNRTAVVNYKDDGLVDLKGNLPGKKRRNINNRK